MERIRSEKEKIMRATIEAFIDAFEKRFAITYVAKGKVVKHPRYYFRAESWEELKQIWKNNTLEATSLYWHKRKMHKDVMARKQIMNDEINSRNNQN